MAAVGSGSGGGRHGTHTAVLCLCALCHTYLLFSVFPYAGYFALYLLDDGRGDGSTLSVDTVGIYVGFLGSAFTFGRVLGFGLWKRARIVLGERNSLLASLLLSAVFSILFGASKTFFHALLWRFLLGLSNGMSGSIKRAAINRIRKPTGDDANGSEEDKDEEDEWALSWILAVMSAGTAFGPAVSGWMSLFGGSSSNPYLPPNMFGAVLCIVSAVSVVAVVRIDETTTTMKHKDSGSPGGSGAESSPLLPRNQSTINDLARRQMERLLAIWKARSTRSHLLGYATFSFCVACIDEALPLFLIAQTGGLELPASRIGLVLAVAGVITALLHQTSTFMVLAERLGLYSSLHLCSVLSNVPMALLPISLTFSSLGASFAFVVLLFGIFRAFAFLYFNLMGNAVTRSVPLKYADDAGRIMMMSGLVARAVAPSVAGTIYTTFAGHPWKIWILIGCLSGIGASFTCVLREAAAAAPSERRLAASSGMAERRKTYLSQRQRARVYTKLWEVHYDRGSSTVGARWRRIARKVVAVNRFAGGTVAPSPSDLPERKLPRRTSWADRLLRPGIDVDEIPFFIIGTSRSDASVLTPPLMDSLQDHLPDPTRGFNYWLKYSLVRDGASLKALESRAGFARTTILAVETLDGHVFGCYMERPWERRSQYEHSGASFLWRMKRPRSFHSSSSMDEQSSIDEHARIEEDVEVYHWTGRNHMCQLFARDKIAVGGDSADDEGDGFGFVLNDQLERGSSGPCKTYDNPCLVPGTEGGQFEVANVEIWALTPFLFEADAERSERNVRFREKSIREQSGYQKAPSSESPWSQFM